VSRDGIVQILSPKDGSLVRELPGRHPGALVTFGPSNNEFTTRDLDGTLRVWGVRGTPDRPPVQLGRSVVQLAYTPDEKSVVTVGADGKIVMRDAITFQPTGKEFVGNRSTGSGDFGPWFTADGKYLVTISDSQGRMWDVASATQIGSVFPSTDGWSGMSSPNAKYLATGTGDRIVRWNLDVTAWELIACRAAGRNLTTGEWKRYGPRDVPYHATCPDLYPAPTG
jgi:WD40 repeat protein